MKMALEAQAQADTASAKGIAANQQQADTALKDIVEQNHSIAKKGDEDDDNLMLALEARPFCMALSSHTFGTIAEDDNKEVTL